MTERNIIRFNKGRVCLEAQAHQGLSLPKEGLQDASPSLTIPANTASAHRQRTLKRQQARQEEDENRGTDNATAQGISTIRVETCTHRIV
jgi:hypothetical protein